MNESTGSFSLPLSPQVFYILVAVSYRSLHAYAIRQQVVSDSDRQVVLSGSTVHDAIKRLLRDGWLEIDQEMPLQPPAYRLTNIGRRYVKYELERLKRAALVGEMALQDGHFIVPRPDRVEY
jgi:DNA-binding PadR family transcriptional regulator